MANEQHLTTESSRSSYSSSITATESSRSPYPRSISVQRFVPENTGSQNQTARGIPDSQNAHTQAVSTTDQLVEEILRQPEPVDLSSIRPQSLPSEILLHTVQSTGPIATADPNGTASDPGTAPDTRTVPRATLPSVPGEQDIDTESFASAEDFEGVTQEDDDRVDETEETQIAGDSETQNTEPATAVAPAPQHLDVSEEDSTNVQPENEVGETGSTTETFRNDEEDQYWTCSGWITICCFGKCGVFYH